MDVDGPFEAILRTMLDGVFSRFLQADTLVLFKVLLTEGQQFPELLRRYHATTMANSKALLGQLLELGVSRGDVRPEALDYDHRLIIAPVILTAMWQLTFAQVDPIHLPGFMDQYVDMLSRALK